MTNSEINRVLEDNGLTDKEARTYTAMLGLGNTTPYKIAKKSGLKAPITYVVLDALLKKGLALKTPYKNGWRFQAKRIDEYLSERQEATASLSSISSILNSLMKEGNDSKITHYEGVEEIRNALKYKLDSTKKFVAFYGSARNLSPDLNSVFIVWYKELKARSIKQRIIAPKDPTLATFRSLDREYGNEIKEVDPSKYDSESSIEIHDSFIRIVMLKKNTCLIIEDDNLPLVLKNIFEVVWNVV